MRLLGNLCFAFVIAVLLVILLNASNMFGKIEGYAQCVQDARDIINARQVLR